ncbi:hypothetical protein D3C73_1224200 [compost metagenome]
MADLHIAYISLAARKKCILQDIPRANQNPPSPDVLLQTFLVLGAYLQIILQNNGLAIQIKAAEGCTAV